VSELRFILLSGPRSRRLCLASVEAPGLAPGAWEVADVASGAATPAQVEGGRAWWMAEDLAAGARREMILRPASAPQAARVDVAGAGDAVRVDVRGDRFADYRYSGVARPYLSPLAGPFGAAVTRRWPMEESPLEKHDHPHHKGCWVAWGDVNGADNWSEQPGHGFVKHQRFDDVSGGAVFGRLAAVNHWTDRDGRKLMTEEREYRFYDTPRGARFFDLAVTFLADEGDVRFGDTKEGGIASVRVASSMDASGRGRIVNSYGGMNEAETWGKRAQWCDYSGPVAGETAGVAIMDHPSNPLHPTWWHVRNYGLMTANPFGRSHFEASGGARGPDGSMTLRRGETMTFRYRVLVHAGDAEQGRVAEEYHGFANPPRTELPKP